MIYTLVIINPAFYWLAGETTGIGRGLISKRKDQKQYRDDSGLEF